MSRRSIVSPESLVRLAGRARGIEPGVLGICSVTLQISHEVRLLIFSGLARPLTGMKTPDRGHVTSSSCQKVQHIFIKQLLVTFFVTLQPFLISCPLSGLVFFPSRGNSIPFPCHSQPLGAKPVRRQARPLNSTTQSFGCEAEDQETTRLLQKPLY